MPEMCKFAYLIAAIALWGVASGHNAETPQLATVAAGTPTTAAASQLATENATNQNVAIATSGAEVGEQSLPLAEQSIPTMLPATLVQQQGELEAGTATSATVGQEATTTTAQTIGMPVPHPTTPPVTATVAVTGAAAPPPGGPPPPAPAMRGAARVAGASTKFESKSRAVAAAHQKGNGNDAETQIKNAKQETDELQGAEQSVGEPEQAVGALAGVAAGGVGGGGERDVVGSQLNGPQLPPRTTPTNLMSIPIAATTSSLSLTTTSPKQEEGLASPDEATLRPPGEALRGVLAGEASLSTMDGEQQQQHSEAAAHDWQQDGNMEEQHFLDLQREQQQQKQELSDNKAPLVKADLVDLFPMKVAQNFAPLIRDSNARLLHDRPSFMLTENAEREDVFHIPNDLDDLITPYPEKMAYEGGLVREQELGHKQGPGDDVNEFTGKLLAERDGVITEIEQKFQIAEYVAATDGTTSDTTTTSTVSTPPTHTRASSVSVNHELPDNSRSRRGGVGIGSDLAGNAGAGIFIDRRVKKNFEFPMHRAASDVMTLPHIDFASTKFNGQPPAAQGAGAGPANSASGAAGGRMTAGAHPEFSTTKFYNSKELYNEMLQHNMQTDSKRAMALSSYTSTSTAAVPTAAARPTMRAGALESAASRYAVVSSSKFSTYRLARDFSKTATGTTATSHSSALPATGMHAAPVTSTTIPSAVETTSGNTIKPATPGTIISSTTPTAHPASMSHVGPDEAAKKLPKHAKELNRAKMLLKVLRSLSNGTAVPSAAAATTPNSRLTNTTTTRNSGVVNGKPTLPPQSIPADDDSTASSSLAASSPLDTTTAAARNPIALSNTQRPTASRPAVAILAVTTTQTNNNTNIRRPVEGGTSPAPQSQVTTNPTKAPAKPIARPRIRLSRLQEKINSLECEIQNVPLDSHLWRGNETHELLLPITSPSECRNEEDNCPPVSALSWEGEAEIQSGDILIVEINDAPLHPEMAIGNAASPSHSTQVYQVTRSGHEHCDATEGILLDITPLVVDGRKLVTLYDKDLTEGVNLLIVVSELWGGQCVRLRVTTKTDNCGETADCSGKGICYSSASMEEYECQCCNGFTGPHCEEIDACTPSPCTNNGICVDLSQGHEGNAYQCLCPYGYTGKNCQYESDPCNAAECMNGGSCVGNSTHFRCECSPGFTGPLCQHSLNECESSPCVHGICVDQEDGFRCFCQPGFAGELCNFEYNECESNPCQNSGECIDHIGSYECRCTKGYTGARCQIKVDMCASKPCHEGQQCIDHGNDFRCECPNRGECDQMPRTQQCNVNPCTHGGTCWTSGDSFYCACRPGFTGTMCEDEFIVETVVSSSEFMVDDANARNFNDKTFASPGVIKSPIELHNAYFAAGVLAAAIFIVAAVVTICHCKVNQTYRKFSTRTTAFIPILGFAGRRKKAHSSKLNKHWLSGSSSGAGASVGGRANSFRAASHGQQSTTTSCRGGGGGGSAAGQLCERPFQRHLAMNLENDMYYTVDFSENSQHSPLIQ